MRKNFYRNSRNLRKKYDVKLKKYDEIGDIKEAMEIFIQLHQKRWESKGMQGQFSKSNRAFRDFHMDISKSFAKKGWLGLYFLTANDEPISVMYAFEYGHKLYNYLTGMDTKYSQYAVGNLIQMYLIEHCIKKGLKEYDLMRGEREHKRKFATITRKNFEVSIVRKGWQSRIYNLMKKEAMVNLSKKLGLHLSLKS